MTVLYCRIKKSINVCTKEEGRCLNRTESLKCTLHTVYSTVRVIDIFVVQIFKDITTHEHGRDAKISDRVEFLNFKQTINWP